MTISYKDTHVKTPIENHETAAWANISDKKPVSEVPIPSKNEVRNAKDYVDANEK